MNFFLDFFYPEKRRREKEERERAERAAAAQSQFAAQAAAEAASAASAASHLPNSSYLYNRNLYVHGGYESPYESSNSYGYNPRHPFFSGPFDGVSFGSRSNSVLVKGRHRGRRKRHRRNARGTSSAVFSRQEGYTSGGTVDVGYQSSVPGGAYGSCGAACCSSSGYASGAPVNYHNRDALAYQLDAGASGSDPKVRSKVERESIRSAGSRPSQGSGFPGMFGRTKSRTLVFPFRRERGSFWGTFRLRYDPRLLKANEEQFRREMNVLYVLNSEYFHFLV